MRFKVTENLKPLQEPFLILLSNLSRSYCHFRSLSPICHHANICSNTTHCIFTNMWCKHVVKQQLSATKRRRERGNRNNAFPADDFTAAVNLWPQCSLCLCVYTSEILFLQPRADLFYMKPSTPSFCSMPIRAAHYLELRDSREVTKQKGELGKDVQYQTIIMFFICFISSWTSTECQI